MGLDQPLFAIDLVSYVGQSIAMVLATTEKEAIRIAAYVVGEVRRLFEAGETVDRRLERADPRSVRRDREGQHFSRMRQRRLPTLRTSGRSPGPAASLTGWWKRRAARDRNIRTRKATVSNAPCLVVENSQLCGGQVHFYMETQACIAIPTDEGRISMLPSTQSPMGMHATTAMALGLQYHQVELEVPPVGGGFGGKTEQTRFVTGPTAVAAKATKVRCAWPFRAMKTRR